MVFWVQKSFKNHGENKKKHLATSDFQGAACSNPWEETKDVACAFKPNAAFFEAYGSAGWEALQRTLQLIPKEIPLLGV